MKKLYLILADIGLIAPVALAALFVWKYGWNLELFWQQMWGSTASTLVMTDLLLSSMVFWIWMFREGNRRGIGNLWVYVVLTLAVGLCFALPLFLFVRERRIEASKAPGATSARPRVAMEGAA